MRLIASIIGLVLILGACVPTTQDEPTQEDTTQQEPVVQEEATTTVEWTGEPWTMDDGPPWPHAEDAPSINAEGTNHREVVAPRDFDFVRPRVEFWVEDPARHAPSGSELAEQRAASRAQSEVRGVDCQVSYLRIQYGGNARLDRLMDMGVCWHYNDDVAAEFDTPATMRRPDGQDGAMAWYDEQGRLRWLDRYGQVQPRFIDGEPHYWEEGPDLWTTDPETGERERTRE